MIRYGLVCERQHAFESWFRDSAVCDVQLGSGALECPVCGSAKIEKQLMAPAVRSSREVAKQRVATPGDARQKKLLEAMRQLRRKVEDSAEYVGERFPEEARRIHYREADERGIYGEATLEEARALAEEGIEAHPLPRLPEDAN
ncbi:MAG TPA: DUF1178 family protein [Aestuariivirgaceae bacterium]|nr:DUF1178 family protein [Aestuariivirgaceae bacterium]